MKGTYNTDEIKVLAQTLLDRIPLVPSNKQTEMEQLLYYLQTRKGSSTEDGNLKIIIIIFKDITYVEKKIAVLVLISIYDIYHILKPLCLCLPRIRLPLNYPANAVHLLTSHHHFGSVLLIRNP